MSRIRDLERFYNILTRLEQKTGMRDLDNCNGYMGWPRRGVYFFFEQSELREKSNKLRVVRVGTHAVSRGSGTNLWDRLRTHKGHIHGQYQGGGNHRSSIFRLHVGTAIINRDEIQCSSWGKGSSATNDIRNAEHPIEVKVSEKMRFMPFLWLKADDEPRTDSVRRKIEKNSVALLSNYQRPAIDPHSGDWLGCYCINEFIFRAGLWNVDYVNKIHDPVFLDIMNYLVEDMQE